MTNNHGFAKPFKNDSRFHQVDPLRLFPKIAYFNLKQELHPVSMNVRITPICLLFSFFLIPISLTAQNPYYPPAGPEWKQRSPEALGFNKATLDEAVDFAVENENSVERDLRIAILKGFSHEPYHELLGPVKERGGPAGIIIKDGYIAASWGDLERVDMTFSVTKSYLSTVAGLAWDRGLIRSLDDSMTNYVWDRTFDGEHNSKITWEHLLTQSSDWRGTLFGLEDWGDRPPQDGDIDDWRDRELHEPGTHFKYNDVRVNLLAYSLLQVWREPLPVVLRNEIMDPIGASRTWRWHGYDQSWTEVDGRKIQSVSGGGHNGGRNVYQYAGPGTVWTAFCPGGNMGRRAAHLKRVD
ncbi:MAG: serine hydrolase [Balneolaceae bacterium]|nr:serine hydrolase [Balneolaceae bacterium]